MHHTGFRPWVILGAVLGAGTVLAHHTYSMFDPTRELSVAGVVAKFEWKNPHTYLWVYVQNPNSPGQYDALAFENGAPFMLTKRGWSKATLNPNDKVTVFYAPLRDGKPGGHCTKITLADGRSLECQGLALATPTVPPAGAR